MNIVVCENIKDLAMQQYKQIERQILDTNTTKEEHEVLVKAQQSVGGTVSSLLQAIGIEVERVMSQR